MPIISRRVGSRNVPRTLENPEGCRTRTRRDATRLVEPLEQRVLLSGTGVTYDTVFGQGGYITGYDVLAVQADHSLIARQVSADGQQGPLVVLHADGSYEQPFTGTPPASPKTNVQADGKYLTVDTDASGNSTVSRHNPDGSLDSSFGSNGVVSTFPATEAGYAPGKFEPERVDVLGGQILVSGTITTPDLPGAQMGAFVHLNADGSVDSSFGFQGITTNGHWTVSEQGHFVVIGPNGNYFQLSQHKGSVAEYDIHGQLIKYAAAQYSDGNLLGYGFTSDRIYVMTEMSPGSEFISGYDFNLNIDPGLGPGGSMGVFPPVNAEHLSELGFSKADMAIDPSGRIFVSNLYNSGAGSYTMAYLINSWSNTGSVSGMIYHDVNGNGIKDAGENSLSEAVYVDLNGNGKQDANEPIGSADTQGHYQIQGVPPGTYAVSVILEPDEMATQPFSGTYQGVTVSAGSDVTGKDFGLRIITHFAGTVFYDQNGDGQLSSTDPPLANWQVYLDSNNNGMLDPGEPVQTTDASGKYVFQTLENQEYHVREVLQPGWQSTVPAPVAGQSSYDLKNFEYPQNIDFGNVPQAASGNGQISGIVFDDANGNGKQQKREKPLAGVQVFADLNHDGLLEAGEPTATTNASGQYVVQGLSAGDYSIAAVPPTGWVATTSASRTSAQLSTDSASVTDRNIGLAQGATVTGLLVIDQKGKGAVNRKSPPLADWRVYVDLNGDGTWEANEPSAITDSNGRYTITGLPAGKVELRAIPVITDAGWTQTRPRHAAPLRIHLLLKKTVNAPLIAEYRLT